MINKTDVLKFALFLALIFSLTYELKAQENQNKRTKEATSIQGTYQIEVLGRANPLIPANLSQIVEKNRDQNKVVYVNLGTMARLKILPLNQIQKSSFKAIEEIVNVPSFE